MNVLPRPARATILAHDIDLADGNRLIYDAHDSVAHQDMMFAINGIPSESAVYRCSSGLLVIATMDVTPHGELLHVSMSYAQRNPAWLTIKAVKMAFYGATRDAMMVLPVEEDYINVHQYCFHLWEMPVAWGIQ